MCRRSRRKYINITNKERINTADNNISKFRVEGNDYVVHDTDAHVKINETNNTLSTFKSETNNALDGLEKFKLETKNFLDNIECSVSHMQNNEYELTLNLNSK